MSDFNITGIKLRAAAPPDWFGVADLLAAAELPIAGARDHFADFNVAESEGIVGCIGLERYGDAGLLRSLAVSPFYRDRGLGRALVDSCVAHARSQGVRTRALLTTTAEHYFERLGLRGSIGTAFPRSWVSPPNFAAPVRARPPR
ncbi:MAG: GNAT family N-acetyltransferase [Longimicrobiales bacterium]